MSTTTTAVQDSSSPSLQGGFSPSDTALVVVDVQYGSASRNHGIGEKMKLEGREEQGAERFDRIETVVVPNIQRLLEEFRRNDGYVVYLTVNSYRSDFGDIPRSRRAFAAWKYGGEGPVDRVEPIEHSVLKEIEPRGNDLLLNKLTIGGFNSSSLYNVLINSGMSRLLVCGVSTNSCVESTVRGAADRHFEVLVVEDACGAAAMNLHDASIAIMRDQFADIITTDDVRFE